MQMLHSQAKLEKPVHNLLLQKQNPVLFHDSLIKVSATAPFHHLHTVTQDLQVVTRYKLVGVAQASQYFTMY